jgi:hypothetical protein
MSGREWISSAFSAAFARTRGKSAPISKFGYSCAKVSGLSTSVLMSSNISSGKRTFGTVSPTRSSILCGYPKESLDLSVTSGSVTRNAPDKLVVHFHGWLRNTGTYSVPGCR